MTEDTSSLLSALHAVDQIMPEIMLGLLADSPSADELTRFGDMFLAAGRLLRQHAGR